MSAHSQTYGIKNTALKEDGFQPFFIVLDIQRNGQKAHAVSPETVTQDEDGRQKSYANERANTYASDFLIPINACSRTDVKIYKEEDIKQYKWPGTAN